MQKSTMCARKLTCSQLCILHRELMKVNEKLKIGMIYEKHNLHDSKSMVIML